MTQTIATGLVIGISLLGFAAMACDGSPASPDPSPAATASATPPLTATASETVLAAILIDTPARWAQTTSPLVVQGTARVFEGTVQYGLYDGSGLPLAEGFTTTSAGAPAFGTFEFEIAYEVDAPQLGSLILWEQSARDGSRINIVEYTIWLR